MPAKQGNGSQMLYSPAVRVSEGATFGLGTNLAWDACLRTLYNQQNAAFTRLANDLLRRGLVTEAETRALVDQRNLLIHESRKPLSPFGKVYSEVLKPVHDLPTYERLIRAKGTNEAILQSVGKTRAYVNRLSLSMKYAGRGMVVINLALAIVVIARAKPEDRAESPVGKVVRSPAARRAAGVARGRDASAWVS